MTKDEYRSYVQELKEEKEVISKALTRVNNNNNNNNNKTCIAPISIRLFSSALNNVKLETI